MKIAPFEKTESFIIASRFKSLLGLDVFVAEANKIYRTLYVTGLPLDKQDQIEAMGLYFQLINKLEGFSMDNVTSYFKSYTKNEFDVFIIAGFKINGGVSIIGIPMQVITLADGTMKYDFSLDIRK